MKRGKEVYDYIIGLLANDNIEEIYIIDDAKLRTIDKDNCRNVLGLFSVSEVVAFVEYGLNVDLNDEFTFPCKVDVFGKEKKISFSAVLSDKLIVFPQFNIRVRDNV